jgi:hypothetical protein
MDDYRLVPASPRMPRFAVVPVPAVPVHGYLESNSWGRRVGPSVQRPSTISHLHGSESPPSRTVMNIQMSRSSKRTLYYFQFFGVQICPFRHALKNSKSTEAIQRSSTSSTRLHPPDPTTCHTNCQLPRPYDMPLVPNHATHRLATSETSLPRACIRER